MPGLEQMSKAQSAQSLTSDGACFLCATGWCCPSGDCRSLCCGGKQGSVGMAGLWEDRISLEETCSSAELSCLERHCLAFSPSWSMS